MQAFVSMYVQHTFPQGDTIENVSNELKNIMENGQYCLYFKAHLEGRLVLTYCPNVVSQTLPHVPQQQITKEPVKCEPKLVTERWEKSKIDNFVQKLGFLDSSQSDKEGKMIQAFRQITDVCTQEVILHTCT